MTTLQPFKTKRLEATDAEILTDREAHDLATALSPEVTKFLPPSSQLAAAHGDVQMWLDGQKSEGAQVFCLYVEGRICGVLMIHLTPENEAMIGYLFAQHMWGKGLASELLSGALDMLGQCNVGVAMGGVDDENVASARILEKHGFILDSHTQQGAGKVKMYRKYL